MLLRLLWHIFDINVISSWRRPTTVLSIYNCFTFLKLSNPECDPDSLLNHEFNCIQVSRHWRMGHATLAGSNLAPHSITLTVFDLSSVQKNREYCSLSEPSAFVPPSQDSESLNLSFSSLWGIRLQRIRLAGDKRCTEATAEENNWEEEEDGKQKSFYQELHLWACFFWIIAANILPICDRRHLNAGLGDG